MESSSSGAFTRAETSARASTLTNRWEDHWPQAEPVGSHLRENFDRVWVRFHSLPDSKRYAETAEEHAEILRRQRALLRDVAESNDPFPLVVIGRDWVSDGWTRAHLRAAWPWRISAGVGVDDREEGLYEYYWIKVLDSFEQLNVLLTLVADEHAFVTVIPPGAEWAFCPYDGGVDVFAADPEARDMLKARHRDWLSPRSDGL